jgi:hypothetical protein
MLLLFNITIIVANITVKLNVLLTCIIVYQYSGTNVMQFLFNLLRIKCIYMF